MVDEVKTPGGIVSVVVDDVLDEYPGAAIEINGITAAVVGWHPELHCFVVSTYNGRRVEPQHSHQWNGTSI